MLPLVRESGDHRFDFPNRAQPARAQPLAVNGLWGGEIEVVLPDDDSRATLVKKTLLLIQSPVAVGIAKGEDRSANL
ncbi:MAG: hypothetical protein P8Z70_07180 [Desulfuromonadales bacterium]